MTWKIQVQESRKYDGVARFIANWFWCLVKAGDIRHLTTLVQFWWCSLSVVPNQNNRKVHRKTKERSEIMFFFHAVFGLLKHLSFQNHVFWSHHRSPRECLLNTPFISPKPRQGRRCWCVSLQKTRFGCTWKMGPMDHERFTRIQCGLVPVISRVFFSPLIEIL